MTTAIIFYKIVLLIYAYDNDLLYWIENKLFLFIYLFILYYRGVDGAGKPLHIDVGEAKAAEVAAGRHDGRRLRVAPEDVLLQVFKSVGLVHAHL